MLLAGNNARETCTIMQRPLGSYPLPASLLGKLKSSGFQVSEDLRDIGVIELSKELNISNSEAVEILKVVNGNSIVPHSGSAAISNHNGGRSALEMLKAEQLQSFIVTFSAQIDGMLGGGVPLGKITEICGAPGVGKTQFSMQLAVDVWIPELFGGVEGEAIFIDTEGSFIVERVVDIAKSAIQHLKGVAEGSNDAGMVESASQFTLEAILSGMHYFRCHDYLELVALINLLPDFVSKHPKVKLVVVDSIAGPFRHGFEDMGLRNRLLSGIAQNLIKLATQCNIAVVLTNQMTTRVNREDNRSTQLVPALGESWGHACTIRIILYWSGRERQAMLYKSPIRKETTVPYQVTVDGIRDVAIPSPGNSQDCVPLSQLLSLSSSQMEELEMSPGYDIDNEHLNFSENGQRGELEQEMNTSLQGHNDRTSKENTLGLSESEIITSDIAKQGNVSLHEKVMTSEKDTCYFERGSQAINRRKRPHPDSIS